MFHIFSLVCFLIYGVKSSFGHPEAGGTLRAVLGEPWRAAAVTALLEIV